MALDPFEVLIDIERKCRKHAKPIPHQQEAGQVWQGIGFVIGDKHFLAPLKEIKEVLAVPLMTSIPAAAPWFLGVTNLRGQVLPVTDLQAFLFNSQQRFGDDARLLVVDFEKTGVGFLVQQVLGVKKFLNDSMKTIIEDEGLKSVGSYLQGEFSTGSSKEYVLSLKKLSQTAQFYHVVRESN